MSAHSTTVLSAPAGPLAAELRTQLSWPLASLSEWQVEGAGCLRVEAASVWLTREGEWDDHVLAPGESLRLQAGDRVTVTPWEPGAPARLVWTPSAGQPERGERVLRAAGLAWRARKAAFMASRAQGIIRAGDSMASAGAA